MPLNPAMREEMLSNPIQRANPLNDPKFKEIQGYNNYDLNNMQALSPRFGEVTPNTVFETVPGDRHMLYGNCKTVLNQIDANLYSQVNEYMDYFYVPMRCVFPVNYEKIVPNPTKGVDIPWKALPQIPLLGFLQLFYNSEASVALRRDEVSDDFRGSVLSAIEDALSENPSSPDTTRNFAINQFLYLATVISRGQLLDYLGYALDLRTTDDLIRPDGYYRNYVSVLQQKIDAFFHSLLSDGQQAYTPSLLGWDFTDTNDGLFNYDYYFNPVALPRPSTLKIVYSPSSTDWRLDSFRAALYDCLERGLFIEIKFTEEQYPAIRQAMSDLKDSFDKLGAFSIPEEDVAEPFVDGGFVNPLRIAAYQLSVAEYMTNDSVDNIYTAELYMQNLRSIMFPSRNNVSQEPTFDYNGVDIEYDLLTTGAFEQAFFTAGHGAALRAQVFASTFLMLRRSLRYGDYFATGRPNLLAVGQLGIPVSQGQVNPIDVTKNLVMQRFLNAVNWVGSRFVNYVTALFGVKPSDTGCHPTFIAHRKIELTRDTVTNTASEQGRQTTNLLGTADNIGFDVFIDDFGVIIGVTSFDVLPMYPAGIDRNFFNSDRYSMFNSMLQNVGDQEIQASEITGVPAMSSNVFAYMVRYAQYKFGISRAHGAFVNSLPGYVMKYPWHTLIDTSDGSIHISPDFIRDKPYYFDQFFAQRSGLSPAAYYHFQVPVTNQHTAARKMQYQPPVLF